MVTLVAMVRVDMDDDEALRAAALLGFECTPVGCCDGEGCDHSCSCSGWCLGYYTAFCGWVTWTSTNNRVNNPRYSPNKTIAARDFLREHGVDTEP